MIQEKALTDAQPFYVYKADGKLHQMERDIAKYWNHRQPDRKRTSCKSRRRIYFRVAADYFAHKRTDPDYRPKDAQAIQHVDEFFKFMAVMTKDDRFAEEVEWEGSEPKTMDKFLDGVEAKGEKIGEERGKRIGIVNERERFATDMLQDGKPLDEIRKYSRLSESAIRKLAESIGVSVL